MATKRALVFKAKFLISVDGHTWTSEYDVNATHENLRIDVEEKVRNHGYIQAHDSICLHLANHGVERTELEAVDENKTLGEVIMCMGRKRLVGLLRSTIPAAASVILIDNDEATGNASLIIHIDPKRVVHGLPAPPRTVTNNTDTGVVVAETSNSQLQGAAGLPASAGQSATEAAGPEVPGHAEATNTLQHPDVVTEVVNMLLDVVANVQPTLANLLPEVPNVELAVGNVELLRSGILQENPADTWAIEGLASQMEFEEDEGYDSFFDYSTRLWSWSVDQ